MVQGERALSKSSCDVLDRSNDSKRAGFAAMHKKEEERKLADNKSVANKDSKYGSWGPVFKNKDHFVNMHLC